MELEPIHISTYFPYGLSFEWSTWGKTHIHTVHTIGAIPHNHSNSFGVNNSIPLQNVTPLLIPIWDFLLTVEGLHQDDVQEIQECISEDNLSYLRHDLYIWLVKNKYDVFKLIDAGLAKKLNV